MRATDIFDIVHERVREYQALAGRIPAIRPDASAHGGPARSGNTIVEYVAEFHLVGRRTLERWPRRRLLFDLYYVGTMEYRVAIAALGVRPGTFDYWAQEIKRAVGPELERAGLFPPRSYRVHSLR